MNKLIIAAVAATLFTGAADARSHGGSHSYSYHSHSYSHSHRSRSYSSHSYRSHSYHSRSYSYRSHGLGGSSRDYYTAASGHRVHRPVMASHAPRGASAHCSDGSYSFSESRRGTCSHHGGVASWM